jgi:signal transduction histidine kinase/DNA-binding response OmpR family regulator
MITLRKCASYIPSDTIAAARKWQLRVPFLGNSPAGPRSFVARCSWYFSCLSVRPISTHEHELLVVARRTAEKAARSSAGGLSIRSSAQALLSGPGVIAVFVLVAILAASGITLFVSQSSTRALIEKRYETKVTSGAALVTTYVHQLATHERLVEAQDLAGPDPSAAAMTLAAESLSTPAAVFLNGQGQLIRAYPADPALVGTLMTTRYVHLRQAHDGRIGVSNVVLSAVKRTPIVAVAIPALSSKDPTVFSAGFDVQNSPLSGYLASAFPHPTAAVYVTDSVGSVVAASGHASSAALKGIDPALASAMSRGPSGPYGAVGSEQYYASAPVIGTPWTLVATIPEGLLNQPLRGDWIPWLLLSVFAALGLLALLLMGRVLADRNALLAARRDLEVARDVALQATEEKSAFLAMMSHEIRTPMNAVIGMTGLLLGTSLDADQREFVETVRNSGDALLGIINDVLDFSKIEAGGLELENQVFNLRECVEDALDVAAAANNKGVELIGELDSGCPANVTGDVTRLRQVLVNLLGNAVKFTDQGHVLLTVEPTGHEAGAGTLRFSVADTGIGIPADRLTGLFDSFSQVDRSTTRLYGGTGLGLTISKQLVEAMGGVLTVESAVGEGSTFRFSVVLAPAPEIRGADPEPGATLAGHSALIVDDSATNRRVVRLQLEGWGMSVVDAPNSDAATGLIGSGAHFDVVVMDMVMPGMTGEELAKRLRAGETTSHIPIILLSGRVDRTQIERPELFFAILSKPLRSARLKETVADALASEVPVDRRLVPRTEGVDATPMRVLLVEDNIVNQRVGRLLLEKLGHLVDVVGNGLEAVDAVSLAPYDAVFMDVQMPVMDGLTATTTIRGAHPPHGQPYIVGLTASVLIEDHQACTEAGMDDFLTKPARLDDYGAVLARAHSASAGPSFSTN